ncbi:CLUMA_CG012906, isoform A [Clunio marinus]|uniref:CLUMA_CG012906, isoform A n=1 Tax=Clunio marinus TaxID=568069 RepID=A0A1J1IIK1_9DIPT|nr:CLUMA_CG012906, isoform A [Clunio marinus]
MVMPRFIHCFLRQKKITFGNINFIFMLMRQELNLKRETTIFALLLHFLWENEKQKLSVIVRLQLYGND